MPDRLPGDPYFASRGRDLGAFAASYGLVAVLHSAAIVRTALTAEAARGHIKT